MKHIIALTGADPITLREVHARILQVATDRRHAISVLEGVDTAAEAQAVYCNHGELWRVGSDDSRPELDALIDRTINVEAGLQMAQVDRCIDAFVNGQVPA